MSKNTLYITFDGLSDPLGQSQILPYLCGIADKGFHITILSCEKRNRLEKENAAIRELIKNLPIVWHYILYNEEGGFLSRLNYIRQLQGRAKRICFEKNISLIHCRSYLASLIGLSFKLQFDIPFLFDMRGFWADERIDGGIWKTTNPLHRIFYNYFKKKEKQFILHANAIVSLTNAGVTELSKHYSSAFITGKTKVIPCCTDTELFNKMRALASPSVPGLSPADHVMIYTGSIGTWYYTREMIDCVLVWKHFIPRIKLLILTKDVEQLRNILATYSPEQQSYIVSVGAGYKEVPAYLSVAKAAIFFIKPSYSKIASSPTKMAECWAMDLPIITNSGIGDNDLYFNTCKGGILVNEFTHSEYEKACKQYLALKSEHQHYREIALRYFDTRSAVQTYSSIYQSLTE